MVDKEFLYHADLEIDRLSGIDRQLVSLEKYVDENEAKLKGNVKMIEYGVDECKDDFLKTMLKMQINYRRKIMDLYSISRNIGTDIIGHCGRSICQEAIEYERSEDEVDVWLTESNLFVRTPLLSPRAFLYRQVWPRTKSFYINSSTIYESYIREKIQRLKVIDPNFFKEFEEKTVTFLFVYDENERMMDVDNADTKASLDAICSCLPHGDMGEFCSVFYTSKRSNTIEHSTYIVVSRGLESPMNSIDILCEAETRKKKLLEQ